MSGTRNRKHEIKMSPVEAVVTSILFLAIIGVWIYPLDDSERDIVHSIPYDGPYEVVKIVDGDTVKLLMNGETTTVRLIGIDTPESVHPNKEKNVPEGTLASDHTKELLEDKLVYVEYDEDPTDHYGRVLAYLYLDENTMVNAQILADGYAEVMTVAPNDKYAEYFQMLEDEAKSNNVGLWATGVFDN